MKNFIFTTSTIVLKSQLFWILISSLLCTSMAYAKWEKIKELPSANGLCITSKGTILISDLGEENGGILRSEDNGITWTKCEVPNYDYPYFFEMDNYIFAGGRNCRVARSADDGKTWEILRYDNVLEPFFDKPGAAEESGVSYSMCFFKGKLYIADFGTSTILYTEDFGNTWDYTDRESMFHAVNDPDYIYHLEEFQGKLYAFGVYNVYILNETDNTWKVVKNSNFLGTAIVFNGKLIASHGNMDMGPEAKCIEYTENGTDWADFPKPTEVEDNAVRILATDGTGIYAGSMNYGIFYTLDEGKNWIKLEDGYPVFSDGHVSIPLTPMIFAFTENDVYVTLYEMSDLSGLYKIPKSELTSIEPIRNESNIKIYSHDNSYLYITTKENSVNTVILTDSYGKIVYNGKNQNRIAIANLAPGIYICSVTTNGKTYTNKLVKN